jgi:hypothetical protein
VFSSLIKTISVDQIARLALLFVAGSSQNERGQDLEQETGTKWQQHSAPSECRADLKEVCERPSLPIQRIITLSVSMKMLWALRKLHQRPRDQADQAYLRSMRPLCTSCNPAGLLTAAVVQEQPGAILQHFDCKQTESPIMVCSCLPSTSCAVL